MLNIKVFFYFLKQNIHDVILLQETHSCSTDEKLWQYKWSGKNFFSHETTNSKGVTVLFKNSLKYELGMFKKDTEGRYFFIEIKFDSKVLVIDNIFAPNKDEPNFLDLLFRVIVGFSNFRPNLGERLEFGVTKPFR